MTHPDTALFLWMAGGASSHPLLLSLACALAQYGPWVCAALMAWAAWRQPRERGHLFALLAMAGATSMLSHGIADLIGLPRPFVLGLSPARITHGASAALPSTHAAVMGLIAFGFAARPSLRHWAPAAALLALATGWARIYVGVHFPSDILAGFVLGAAMLALFVGLQWLARQRIVPAFARIQQSGEPPQEQAP